MKLLKDLLVGILILALIFGVFAVIYSYSTSRPYPGDFPNSKWVYDGEYTKIELTVKEDHSNCARIVTADGEKEVFFLTRPQMQSVNICVQKEGDDWFYDSVSQGSYRCNEKKMIMTSSYYSPEWRMEDSELIIDDLEFTTAEKRNEEIKLEFVRVE